MNKLMKKGLGTLAAIGGFFGVNVALAAPDTDFAAAVASSSANINDNVPTILDYIQTTGGKALLIGVVVTLVIFGIAMIRGSISLRRKRR